MTPIEEISQVLRDIGAERYGDGSVSQLQHALQCAALAEREGSSAELITAALLHDIGHMVDAHYEGAAESGVDRKHERIGSAYLAIWFGSAVTEPVLLHVAAKRYLCAVDGEYFDGLSPGSVRSLRLQGGELDAAGAKRFLANAHAKDAIRLRRWDDMAKDPEAVTEDLDHYLSFVSVALERAQAA